jgi:hypothetical protein
MISYIPSGMLYEKVFAYAVISISRRRYYCLYKNSAGAAACKSGIY